MADETQTTPNLGAGGNAAIESAAALANSISRLSSPKSTLTEIKQALNSFHEKRHPREANLICSSSDQLTRLDALATPIHKFLQLHVIPVLGDCVVDMATDSNVGVELLEYLSAPVKSLDATKPYNPEKGVGKKEKKWVRALYALPILAFFFAAHKSFGAAIEATPITPTGILVSTMVLEDGLVVPFCLKYVGWSPFDQFIAKYAAIFTASIGGFDPVGRMQAIAFLADIVPIQVILQIESVRRGNSATVSYLLPTIISVFYQFFGICYLAPIYFFFHYVQCPLENYAAVDIRLTQISAVRTVIPTVLLTYIIPAIAMFSIPGLTNRQWVNGLLWQPFPIYASILQHILKKFVKDTTSQDRITNPEADMPYLRRVYAFAASTAAAAYFYVRFTSPFPLTEVFFHNLGEPSAAVSVMQGAAKMLRYDHIVTFGAGSVWILLSFYDLKRAKKLQAGWGKILGVFGGTMFAFGPGAAMAVMWAWREEALARREMVTIEKKVKNF